MTLPGQLPAARIQQLLAIEAAAQSVAAVADTLGLPGEEVDLLRRALGSGDTPPGRAWPSAKRVGRLEDMSPDGQLVVMLDNDNDVIVAVSEGGDVESFRSASVEFCCPGMGGVVSPRTREALITLMVAIEQDNAQAPHRDAVAARARGAK